MYRTEAINNRKINWQGRAILLPGIPFRYFVLFTSFFLISLLFFVTEFSYTRRINVSGEVSTYPNSTTVYSSVQGIVIKQFVKEGKVLNKGDPIYQVDISKSIKSGLVGNRKKEEINSQLKQIAEMIDLLKDSKKNTLSMLKKQLVQYKEAYRKSIDFVEKANEGLKFIKNNVESYKHYKSIGLITKDQLSSQVSLYYERQNNMLGLISQSENNSLQVTTIESQMKIQSADFDKNIHKLELQRYDLQKELLNIDADQEIIVRARTEGKVDSLSVTVGQMVSIGDSLLKLTPKKIDHYNIILWVENEALPYISIGDQVNIRYEAFPSAKFGQFGGKISLISKTPASLKEMMTYRGSPKNMSSNIPYYKVIIRPDEHTIRYRDRLLNLDNGMKAESTLFLEKRKIYQWMLSPFYDLKNSAIGPVNG